MNTRKNKGFCVTKVRLYNAMRTTPKGHLKEFTQVASNDALTSDVRRHSFPSFDWTGLVDRLKKNYCGGALSPFFFLFFPFRH